MDSNGCEEDEVDELAVDIDRINQTLGNSNVKYDEEDEETTSDEDDNYYEYGNSGQFVTTAAGGGYHYQQDVPSTSGGTDVGSMNVSDLDYGFSDSLLEKCLFLNRTYQEAIMKSIRELENFLFKNRERQEVIQEKLKVSTDETGRCSNGRYIKTRKITIPYFKDSNGLIPPPNEEVKLKAANDELPNHISFPRAWSEKDKSQLNAGIERSALELKMQPLLARKEILALELCDVNLVKKMPIDVVEAKQKEIEEKDLQIELLKSRKPSVFIGPLDQDYDWMNISVKDFNGDRSPRDCELYWKNFLHSSINKSPFSKAELEKLRSLIGDHGTRNWDVISKLMDRTPYICAQAYFSNLDSRRKWTDDENQDLLSAVEVCRVGDYIPWHQVCYFIEGRTACQVRNHWLNYLDPSIRKGKWTEKEDIQLLTGIFLYGTGQWWKVKDYVKNRTGPQCCERWKNTLDPSLDISEFTPLEDKRLLELVEIHGKKWAFIGEELGRTDNRCLSRWKSLVKSKNKTVAGQQIPTLSKFQLVAYRNAVYKNFVGRLLEVHDGDEIGTKSVISRSQLMKSLSRLSNKNYVRSPGEDKFGQLLRQYNVNALTDVMKYKPRPTLPVLTPIDKLLNEYFMLTLSRKPPGRPPKIKTVEDDDPIYLSAVDKFDNILSDCKQFRLVPFLPPVTITMQAFRNMLMMRGRLIKNSHKTVSTTMTSKSDVSELEREEEESTDKSLPSASGQKDSYAQLFMQFLPLFAWPAILSATKPNPEPVKPPRKPTRSSRGRKKLSKQQKDPTFRCLAGVNDVTIEDSSVNMDDEEQEDCPLGKKSNVDAVSAEPSRLSLRRSSRLTKTVD